MTHRPSCYNYYSPCCSCLVLQPSRARHLVFRGSEYKAPHEAEMPEAEEMLQSQQIPQAVLPALANEKYSRFSQKFKVFSDARVLVRKEREFQLRKLQDFADIKTTPPGCFSWSCFLPGTLHPPTLQGSTAHLITSRAQRVCIKHQLFPILAVYSLRNKYPNIWSAVSISFYLIPQCV